MIQNVQKAFVQLPKRAESTDPSKLVATFVDIGPLFTILSSNDHQILYGRRGTGKTHLLFYLAENRRRTHNDFVVYVDLRTIGSSSGLYYDGDIAISERATRLLVDTLGTIHDELLNYFIEHGDNYDLSRNYSGGHERTLDEGLIEGLNDIVPLLANR